MTDSFFVALGEGRWQATAHTRGPWDGRFQHGGPPSALLGRAVEQVDRRDEVMVARMTVEILGPIPVGELSVQASVTRPGRSVEMVEASLAAGGRDVARARAWRVLRTTADVPTGLSAPPLPDPSPYEVPAGWLDGYLSAVEWRLVAGDFAEPGPGIAWSRLRYPLVDGEAVSPLQRVLAVADSGNGLSSAFDPTVAYFINPELTVHLHREAVGEWICLDARTTVSPGGVGLATSVLSDATGPIGVGAQSLLVSKR